MTQCLTIRQCSLPGEQVRDFLHVDDVAEAIWAVATSDLRGPVNIGFGRPVTVRSIAERIGVMLNRPELIDYGALPYGPSDPMFICANTRKLLDSTKWSPRYDLDDGLYQTVQWWQKGLGISRHQQGYCR
jgi:nucleoside-diphosphate-sugar epimerase